MKRYFLYCALGLLLVGCSLSFGDYYINGEGIIEATSLGGVPASGYATGTPIYVETISDSGGTVTDSVYSTVLGGYSDNELVTAGWVRGLLAQGVAWYGAPNPAAVGFATNWVSYLATEVPATLTTATFVLASSGTNFYLGSGITTSTFTSIDSPVTFAYYLSINSANPNAYIDVKPEIYYTWDMTNLYGDYDTIAQRITGEDPVLHTYVMSFPEPTITGEVYVVGRIKYTDSATATALNVFQGTGAASHFDISE